MLCGVGMLFREVAISTITTDGTNSRYSVRYKVKRKWKLYIIVYLNKGDIYDRTEN